MMLRTQPSRSVRRSMLLLEPEAAMASAVRHIRAGRPWLDPDVEPGSILHDLAADALIEGLPAWVKSRSGHLYIAANASWPGLYKLGCTRRSVSARMASLNTAGLPTPWVEVWAHPVHDAHYLEAQAHHACALWWARGEFFEGPPARLIEQALKVCAEDIAQLSAELTPIIGEEALHQWLQPVQPQPPVTH